ncbi:hypothetical protein [Bradyrhizobium sp. NBAIM08]|uniref:hypothetical protein n=1 Tax=Bradyrhizobium sp. NBAIM08 TaxID=2793815 RepID=UPI001CD5292A|nr:hypothetical protein [Bradyrhizobium sp. NBAIM08]MCA1474296.1 hypothetical protein [Bradyrhizobium sp. NBAIM08]
MPKDSRDKPPLHRQFEQFDDVIRAAGPQPTSRELARYWTERADHEERMAELKRRNGQPSRRR